MGMAVSLGGVGVSEGVLVLDGSAVYVGDALGASVSVAVGVLVGGGVFTGISVGELVGVGVSDGVIVGVCVWVCVCEGVNFVNITVTVVWLVGELVAVPVNVVVGVGLDARSWATLTIKYPAQ